MRITLLLPLLLFNALVFSQNTSLISLFDKLYRQNHVRFTLTYPFDSLDKSRNNVIDAFLNIESDSGALMINQPLTISIRGKYRRMKCTFPPLLLNFKKSTLEKMHLNDVDEIKLVTHCLDGSEGLGNIQEERMMYQVYESITPASYRTIWMTIYYCDLENPGVCDTSSAFLLEPDKVLSARLGLLEKKVFNVAQDSLQYDSYGSVAAFNFMIGNLDWSVNASRNAKLFYDARLRKYVVVPYDFDYSNVVNASYRKIPPSLAMPHPFDRMYQGEYFNDKAGAILKSFYDHESSVIQTLNTAENPMGTERRQQIIKYFESWFDMISKHKPGEMNFGMVVPYKGGL